MKSKTIKETLEIFSPYTRGAVAVLGCGEGKLMAELKDKVVDLFGISDQLKDIEKIREKGMRGDVMLLENIHVYLERKFDTVMLVDVIDEFHNRHALLRNCQWLMDKQSKLLIKTIEPVDEGVIDHFEDIFDIEDNIDNQYFVLVKREI